MKDQSVHISSSDIDLLASHNHDIEILDLHEHCTRLERELKALVLPSLTSPKPMAAAVTQLAVLKAKNNPFLQSIGGKHIDLKRFNALVAVWKESTYSYKHQITDDEVTMCINLLKAYGFRCGQRQMQGERVFVFASQQQIKTLSRRSFLTLVDLVSLNDEWNWLVVAVRDEV
jgi:hypothetical protein